MYNAGRNQYSHGRGFESYPSLVPQVDHNGIPIPPSTPMHHPIPLPPKAWQPHIHPLLRYTQNPSILYDVRRPPSYASAPNARLEWTHEPATNPSSPEMIITCYALPRGPFIIRPSARNYDFVTIFDILIAVHHEFVQAMNGNGASWTSMGRPSSHGTELLLTGPGLSKRPYGRYIWKGLSEEQVPGNWLLHIE